MDNKKLAELLFPHTIKTVKIGKANIQKETCQKTQKFCVLHLAQRAIITLADCLAL